MEALAFAARRVQSDPVAMLFAARDLEGWDFDAAGYHAASPAHGARRTWL